MNLDILWINQKKVKAAHQNDSDATDLEDLEAARNGNLYRWKPVG